MNLRPFLYGVAKAAAYQLIDPKLKAGLPIAFEVLDAQINRATVAADPGIAMKGLDVAVRMATGEKKAETFQMEQLSDLFDPQAFAFHVARAQLRKRQ